jgi:hypothetical protein
MDELKIKLHGVNPDSEKPLLRIRLEKVIIKGILSGTLEEEAFIHHIMAGTVTVQMERAIYTALYRAIREGGEKAIAPCFDPSLSFIDMNVDAIVE